MKYRKPINKVSARKRKILANQAKIKATLPQHCFFCGRPATDPMHIIPQSYSIALQDDPRNIIAGCRLDHILFDDNLMECNNMYPDKVAALIEIAKSLDSNYANKMLYKIREHENTPA